MRHFSHQLTSGKTSSTANLLLTVTVANSPTFNNEAGEPSQRRPYQRSNEPSEYGKYNQGIIWPDYVQYCVSSANVVNTASVHHLNI